MVASISGGQKVIQFPLMSGKTELLVDGDISVVRRGYKTISTALRAPSSTIVLIRAKPSNHKRRDLFGEVTNNPMVKLQHIINQ